MDLDNEVYEEIDVDDNPEDIGASEEGEYIDDEVDENDDESDDTDDDEDIIEDEEEVTAPPKRAKQDKKQNAAFAKMRKELEDTKLKLNKYDKWAAQFKDKGADSMDAYIQGVNNQMISEKEQQLIDMGYDPKAIKMALELDPEYQSLKEQNQTLLNEITQQKTNQAIYEEYNALAQRYPKLIKSPEDIGDEVWSLHSKGYSLKDAYLSVNEDKIFEQNRKEVKQKTLNNVNGKSHLKVEGDGPADIDIVNVPTDIMDNYIDMGYSKKQAQEHYAKLYGKKRR